MSLPELLFRPDLGKRASFQYTPARYFPMLEEVLSEEELVPYYAWAAGFIDGEGTITLIRSNGRLDLFLIVGNTAKESLDRLSSLFGGSVFNRKRSVKRKDIYYWKVSASRALNAIDKVEPYS